VVLRLALAGLLLTGCAVGPPPPAPSVTLEAPASLLDALPAKLDLAEYALEVLEARVTVAASIIAACAGDDFMPCRALFWAELPR